VDSCPRPGTPFYTSVSYPLKLIALFPKQSVAQAGAEYSLFGGGVKGKYISLTPSSEIVQTWALQSPTWPSGKTLLMIIAPENLLIDAAFLGHLGTLTTTLAQSTDSTKVIFSLAGVPSGLEDEIKRNIEGY
jgi:activator of HSP90 ATPase